LEESQIEPEEMVQLKADKRHGHDAESPANTSAASRAGFAVDLTVDVVRTVAGVAELQRDFAHLQSVTGNRLPFASYEWQLTWCRHFLDQDPEIIDQPMFYVVRDGGACVAMIPLIRTTRRLGGLNVSSVSLLGADPAITEIRMPLVQPGYEESVAEAVDARLRRARDWDWIQWIGACSDFDAAIGRLRGLRWQPLAPSYALDLPPTWEELRAGFKRNIRESLRHCYNSLKRDGHEFQFRIASDKCTVRGALDQLFELHARRAAMQGTIAHANRFASPKFRDFICDVCEEFAARGKLRVFQIEIAGNIVASRIGFVTGDSLYLYYSGFDPDWARYGVMTTTIAEALKYAIAQGLKTVNLSPGNDVSKTRWGPGEVPHQTAYEHSGRLRSRFVRHVYLTATSGQGVQGWLLQRLMPGRRSWN
jgi:CelD/BcsL family acetyltransferase involved in cellulose biosynthesis